MYDGTRTTLHEGVITLGEAAKVDPELHVLTRRPKETEAQIPLRWKLWIGQDHLVRRCQSSYVLLDYVGWGGFDPLQFADDVRLSRWGHPADIRPPAADQVATLDELTFPDKDPAGSP